MVDETEVKERCDLQTVDDVASWLSRPENQIHTLLYVIKWDGATPKVATSPIDRLADGGRALLEVVLLEHRRRRFRPRAEEDGEEKETEE